MRERRGFVRFVCADLRSRCSEAVFGLAVALFRPQAMHDVPEEPDVHR